MVICHSAPDSESSLRRKPHCEQIKAKIPADYPAQETEMKICGVELTGSDAVVCLLNLHEQQYTLPECRVRKLSLPKDHTREDLQKFQFAFNKLMHDYSVDRVAIKERMTKGKFAGSAASFKMESAIQLIEALDVVVLSPASIKSLLSENPRPVSFPETGLKGFQEAAFITAFAAHSLKKMKWPVIG